MDTPETNADKGVKPEDIPYVEPVYRQKIMSAPINTATLKDFFQFTGGSSLYCLSAVFIAYGIVMVLKPILAGSNNLRDALPCLLTLHAYELALLGVLILIVFKKVVDDAISLAILASLFLVGTSIALGSVADRAIKASMYIGLAGIILAFLKVYAMRRLARIPFRVLSVLGIIAIITYNYLGPVLIARSVSNNPTDELARRNLWLLLYLFMLIGAAIVWIEAVRSKLPENAEKKPFLQSPVMVYLLAMIIIGASGVHQYTMAYAFTLERVMLDYVPIIAAMTFLLIELLRHAGKKNHFTEAAIACIPLALTLYAIYEKSVLSSGRFGPQLLCYPPVMLGGIGLAIAALALYQQNRWLWIAVYAYGLGIILTFGFSPKYPHDLNIFACAVILVTTLIGFGLFCRNPYLCLAGIVLLSLGIPSLDFFSEFVKRHQLTEFGSIAGICGFGMILIYLLFTEELHWSVRIAGAVFLASFVLDYLPASIHWRYAVAILGLSILIVFLWIRTRNLAVISILLMPLLIKSYILAKQLAAWRYVITGFLLLAAGAVVSLFKRPTGKDLKSEREPSGPPLFHEQDND